MFIFPLISLLFTFSKSIRKNPLAKIRQICYKFPSTYLIFTNFFEILFIIFCKKNFFFDKKYISSPIFHNREQALIELFSIINFSLKKIYFHTKETIHFKDIQKY